MKERKKIDRFFSEGFKDFEASPSPHLWDNIQKELEREKNGRKPIPLWIKYGGVAALLALFLSIGTWMFKSDRSLPDSITNENSVDSFEKVTKDNDALQVKSPEQKLATENNNSDQEKESNDLDENGNSHSSTSRQQSKNALVTSGNAENAILQPTTNSKTKDSQTPNGKLNGRENNTVAKTDTRLSDIIPNQKDKSFDNLEKEEGTQVDFPESQSQNVAVGQIPKSDTTDEKVASSNKKSLLDAVAEKKEQEKEDEEKDQNAPERRWNITPNVAPVYYGAMGSGSSIAPDFSDNPKSGDVNMSYGLQVSYAIGKRLSIRTGLNNVDLSYSTSNIVIATGPVARALPSVDYGSQQTVVTALNSASLNTNAPGNGFGEITLKSTGSEARLVQSINYYEVPLEVKYALIDSKFGFNLIGGVSTLFLGSNEVAVKSDNFSSVLGEANNLSNVSFSTNVGLGMDYKLSKSFIFNIEPMFKYQINPYSDSSVDFKPFYLGIYSGLSLKF